MKYYPIISAILALIASYADLSLFAAPALHDPNTKAVPQEETTMFLVYMLPSLIGFVASLASPWAKQASGIVMILSGIMAGLMLINPAISLIVAFLYVIGGITLLFEKAIHEATNYK